MAIINKTGITTGGTINAEHVTRAIDALSGGSTDTVIATGSFSGSFTGIATSASFATTASFALNAGAGAGFPFTGSARITGSLGVTGSASFTGSLNVVNSFAASGSYLEVTAQNFLINASNVPVGTSVAGSNVTFSAKTSLNLRSMNNGAGFVIPLSVPAAPSTGSMYFDTGSTSLYIYDGTQWTFITLGT
jgi:hypothetical protein